MSYAEVAQKVDIDWCPGPGAESRLGKRCLSPNENHHKGYADIARSTVHWTDRRVHKNGLRRFLMLVAACRFRHNRGQPKWQQIYEQNTWAWDTALTVFHRRFPHSYSNTDRARVHFLLRKATDTGFTYRRARYWANNRYH